MDFDLSFEVMASGPELSEIEVLGHPLASDETPQPAHLDDAVHPHRVTFQRRGGALFLGLDGGPLLVLPGTSTDEWLVARGLPESPTILRVVRLTW